jgi:hypothetical protein
MSGMLQLMPEAYCLQQLPAHAVAVCRLRDCVRACELWLLQNVLELWLRAHVPSFCMLLLYECVCVCGLPDAAAAVAEALAAQVPASCTLLLHSSDSCLQALNH